MKIILCTLITILALTNQATAMTTFRGKFIELATNDGVLDKIEYQYLKKLAQDPSLHDAAFAEDTLKNLSKYSDRIKLEYTLQVDGTSEQTINFTFTPSYSESEKISGKNAIEIISNISQKDNFNETSSDNDRCAAASMINAYLLMNGNFAKLAGKYNIGKELTYKNIHLLQDKIYRLANTDGTPGIYSGYKYKSYSDGNIFDIKPNGEIIKVGETVGIKLIPLLGNNTATIHNRKKEVNNFFSQHPYGVIQVGVKLDLKNGDIRAPRLDSDQNHVIIIFKRNKKIYMADTSSINNGMGKNVRLLSESQLGYLVYNTSAIVLGLLIK
ncbi:MAG: hypothetical protein H7263_02770 [Candidatus Sericytochromatia bacterium]|nr:hypothetical protein [Candidatus Sericytochromatia bacterium]